MVLQLDSGMLVHPKAYFTPMSLTQRLLLISSSNDDRQGYASNSNGCSTKQPFPTETLYRKEEGREKLHFAKPYLFFTRYYVDMHIFRYFCTILFSVTTRYLTILCSIKALNKLRRLVKSYSN